MPALSRPRIFRRLVIGLAAVCLTGGLAGAGYLADMGAKRLIVPKRRPLEPWMAEMREAPGEHGYRIRDFSCAAADGVRLSALLTVPAEPVETARTRPIRAALAEAGIPPVPANRPRGTIILLHGFNTRKENMLPFAERFTAAGFRCVAYDSRGHGDSGGDYATFGAREVDDFRRVLAETRRLTGDTAPVGLFGYSMGGAVALQAQPVTPGIGAVCSAAAFAELRSIVTNQAGGVWNGAGLPLLPALRWNSQYRADFDPWDISPAAAARSITCPVLLLHGAADTFIPASHCGVLAEACGDHCEESLLIPGGTHGSLFTAGGDSLHRKIALFFVRHAGG